MDPKIAVIGLGYVGLPVTLAFGRRFAGTIGFDVDKKRVSSLNEGVDRNNDVLSGELDGTTVKFTSSVEDLKDANFFVVAVPTPIDEDNTPDLTSLIAATRTVGSVLRSGSVVVYESTVYPSVTEMICGPVLAESSGLNQGVDFKLGYSPERINPGDREHTLATIVKIVAGEDAETLQYIADVYGEIIEAGIYKASSIKVAEAAKVIENTQRDLNIALMNELAIIFDRMGIATTDVVEAAATKWNFLKFEPGLVGGHCIGVDPYYLTTKAEHFGYHPQVILAGRRINDGMGQFIAQRTIKLLGNAGLRIKGAKVGILGLAFKEDVSDLRNSRVPSIVGELKEFGVVPAVHDPLVDPHEVEDEYGITVIKWDELQDLDGLIVAVGHNEFLGRTIEQITDKIKQNGVFVDVKSKFDRRELRKDLVYWSL